MPPLDPARILPLLAFDPKDPLGFISGLFLVLALALLIVYPLAGRTRRGRVWTLLAFSLYFYYKAGGPFLALILGSTLVDFLLGEKLEGAESRGTRRALLWTGVAANLAVLIAFKYTRGWLGLFQGAGGAGGGIESFALPVGISYYTFQKISYLADVFRKKAAAVRRLDDFLLYVLFFPRVVAGPIVRAGDFFPQLDQPYAPDRSETGEALALILSGLFKKAVIADFIGISFVDRVFAAPALYSGLENLLAVYGYAIQIYCDFSGYTDIALGVARLLGIRLPPNFRSPYKSVTVSDFWRRWHITLSNWLRDYLFLPLAFIFSRRTKEGKILGVRSEIWAAALAALLTWFFCGVWHGAAWGFIIWGLLHGLAISVENMFRLPKKAAKTRSRRFLGRVLTFHYVCLAWIFFRSSSPAAALAMLSQIFAHFKAALLPQFVAGYPVVFALIALGYVFHLGPDRIKEAARKAVVLTPLPLQSLLLAAMIWLVYQFRAADIQPFIYFRF